MRGTEWLLVLVTLAWAAPVGAQELRGFLVLEGNPGYLTNAYLDPGFATWAPEIESAFGAAGATGLLEWGGDRTTVSGGVSGRWMAFADSTNAWHFYLVRGGLEQRLGGGLAVGADGSYSEIRQPAERRTVWGQATLRWTASPRLRLGVGPGIAARRFAAVPAEEEQGAIPLPPLPGDGSTGADGAGEETRATSYLMFATLEAWPGIRWQVRGDLFGSHTEATDLGIDYRGGGGSLRLTRWLGRGISVTAAGGLEGFGYRAAAETAEDPAVEVPEDDLIWRAEVGLGWPVGRAELQARVAGLGREGSSGTDGVDLYASAGVRLTLGGTLSTPRREAIRWTPAPDGVRVRVDHEGPGRLFLVGDFNGWAEPGVPLRSEGDGVHAATLRLEPGSYRYRIRLVVGEEERWLDLPKDTPTVEDGFGGTNGLVVVGEDPGTTERE